MQKKRCTIVPMIAHAVSPRLSVQAWLPVVWLAVSVTSIAEGHPSLDPAGIPDGQWPLYRHDSRLSGHANGRGAILKPLVRWRLPMGLRPTDLVPVVEPVRAAAYDFDRDGHPDTYSITPDTLTVTAGGPKTKTYTFTIPKGETDRFNAACVKVGDFLRDVRGLEIVAWTSHMSTGTGRGRLFAFDEGIDKGRVVWTTPPMERTCYSPEMVVADTDHDGTPDIVLAPHDQIFVVDMETGAVKQNVKWDIGRNYGMLAAANADDDPELEAFVLNDFTLHMSMIDFNADGGHLAWVKNYKPDLDAAGRRPMSFRIRPDAVADVHGDGYPDLIVNRLDERADGKWHVVVMATDTGQDLCDLPNNLMAGVADLDGDNVKEVICQGADTHYPRRFGPIRVFNLDTQRPDFRGEIPAAKLLWREARFPLTISSIANDGQRTPLITEPRGNKPAQIWTLQDNDGDGRPDAVSTWELDKTGLVESWSFRQPGAYLDLRSVDVSKRGKVEVEIADLLGGKRWTGEHGKDLEESEIQEKSSPGFTSVPVTADLDGDGKNEIVVEDALQMVRVLAVGDPEKEGGAPVLKWSHPGHGMIGMPGFAGPPLSVQVADLDFDRKREVILATTSRQDEPELTVLRQDGSVLWSYPVVGVTASGIDAGMDMWFPGQFVGDGALDVYCSYHTLEKGSSRAVMLDGRTGRPAWQQDTITVEKTKEKFAFGAYGGSVLDVNNDSFDDLVLTHYSALGIHDGKTGNPLQPVRKWADDYFPKWVAYSWPTVLKLYENDEPIVYTNCNSYAAGAVGAIRLSGERVMYYPLENEQGAGGFQAVGDGDDDGYVEVGYGHLDGRFVCYNLNTGQKRWEHRIAAGGTSDVILADIDGDDVAEFVFCDNQGRLVALRIEEKPEGGRELWSIELAKGTAGVAGRPIAADVDGDGKLEILLVSQFTGELICVSHDPTYKPPATKPTTRKAGKATTQPAGEAASQPAADAGKPAGERE